MVPLAPRTVRVWSSALAGDTSEQRHSSSEPAKRANDDGNRFMVREEGGLTLEKSPRFMRTKAIGMPVMRKKNQLGDIA